MATPVQHPRLGQTAMVASPINFAGLQTGVRQVAALTPADTDDVLTELGYSREEIQLMRAEGVI